LFYLRG